MLCQLPHTSKKERKNCANLREGFSLTTYLMLKKINRKSQKRQTFMSQPFLLHQTGCAKKTTKFPWLLVTALWVTKMAACFHCAFCAVQSRNTITVTAVFWADNPNSNCDEDEIFICLTFPFLFCVHLRLLFEMESTLVDIEHTIFKNSKTDIGYKTAMLKKVPWINVLESWPFQFR